MGGTKIDREGKVSSVKVNDQIKSLLPGAILVIDDDATIREMLTDILSLLTEAAVYTAANGHEGLKILQQRQSIALILLDMNMPLMNGEETYERVQQIAPEIPVIVSSSLSPGEARFRFGQQAFPTYLQKPYNVSMLLDVVHSVSAGSPLTSVHAGNYNDIAVFNVDEISNDNASITSMEQYDERRTEE